MQTPYIESSDPRYKLDRQIREASRAFIEDKITTAELLAVVSKIKAASHV